MLRKHIDVRSVLAAVLLVVAPLGATAQEAPPTEEAEAPKKLGFYFGMSLEKLSQLGQANGIGLVVDAPAILGGSYSAAGQEIDGDFRSRWALGFKVGFRLRNDNGNIEGRFFQWDEQQDLFEEAPDGKAIANTLASPEAGYAEDVGQFLFQGAPDGSVDGMEAGALSEEGASGPDAVADGAEDLNYNGRPDFIRFGTSDQIVGEMKTDFKVFDIDYVRTLKRVKRLTLDGRAGLRVVSVDQLTDLGYRDIGSFAVYSDDEGRNGVSERVSGTSSGECGYGAIQDGDGDGETVVTENEADGDGFMDGNCNASIKDSVASVETVSEDRIIANISASGIGLLMGLDGRFELSKKWRVSGAIGVSLLSGETEFRYRETFTGQRDRYANFIDWDFNGDGLYDNFDLDFDGSCDREVNPVCTPTVADSAAMLSDGAFRYVDTRIRDGAEYSYSSNRLPPPRPGNSLGVNTNAFTGAYASRLREGDPVPESERNRDIYSETTLLHDVSGSADGLQPMLDLNVGLEYQFSKFAHFDFGIKSTRWFGAGSFREVANDVVAGRTVDADGGDFSMTGMYFTVTIVPR